jgi:DNA-binding NtrC family response regulator
MHHLFISIRARSSAPLAPFESLARQPVRANEGEIEVPVRPAPEPRAPPPAENDECTRILQALEKFAGNQTRAAAYLGMSRTTLSARLDAHGIPRPRKRR